MSKTLFFININANITRGNRSINCNPNTILDKFNKNLHKFRLFITFNVNVLYSTEKDYSDST